MSEPFLPKLQTERVDGIPVQWAQPQGEHRGRKLVLFVPSFGGSNAQVADLLLDIAKSGAIGLSLDPWQHGERSTEPIDAKVTRVFSAFRKHMWPIIGQTTLDAVRVIDWAIDRFGAQESVNIGGLSMGGDVAVAAAGIERRIKRVFAVVATPDWTRPGMRHVRESNQIIAQGEADDFAQFFYAALNPLTHLDRYCRDVRITFLCGADDTHVPPDGAQRFQQALTARGNACRAVVNIQLIEGASHMIDRSVWWPPCLTELTAS